MHYDEIVKTIREALKQKNTNAYRAAKDAGLPENAIRYMVSGQSHPTSKRLLEICEALGLEFYIGPPRGPESLKEDHRYSDIADALGLAANADMGQILSAIGSLQKNPRLWSAGALPDIAALKRAVMETNQFDPYGALNRAEILIGDEAVAFDGDTLLEVAAAFRAIEISPLCADAYLDVIHLLKLEGFEKKRLLSLTIEAAVLAIGTETFVADRGHFWSVPRTRPYIRARTLQADMKFDEWDWQSAAQEYQAIIDLNNHDNLGCRYRLMACLLELNDNEGLLKVFDQFDEEGSIDMYYTRALFEFKQVGADNPLAYEWARKGYALDTLVPILLHRYKNFQWLPYIDDSTPNEEVEALSYVDLFGPQWAGTEGAVEWLLRVLKVELVAEPARFYKKQTALNDDPAARGEPGSARRPVDTVAELAAAAGSGAEALDETVTGQLWFRRNWLDKSGLDATQCVVISVRGESMEPTLPDGCSILVDRSRTRRLSGHVYVLRTDEGIVVKRLAHGADGWVLASDHPAWKDRDWPDEGEVIGEVRWMARGL